MSWLQACHARRHATFWSFVEGLYEVILYVNKLYTKLNNVLKILVLEWELEIWVLLNNLIVGRPYTLDVNKHFKKENHGRFTVDLERIPYSPKQLCQFMLS